MASWAFWLLCKILNRFIQTSSDSHILYFFISWWVENAGQRLSRVTSNTPRMEAFNIYVRDTCLVEDVLGLSGYAKGFIIGKKEKMNL